MVSNNHDITICTNRSCALADACQRHYGKWTYLSCKQGFKAFKEYERADGIIDCDDYLEVENE